MEVASLLQDIMKELTLKQLNLSMTKMSFEKRQKDAVVTIGRIFDELLHWVQYQRSAALKLLESVSERRRQEMEEISASLICLPPRLFLLHNNRETTDVNFEKAMRIRNESHEIYSTESCEQLPILDFNLSTLAQKIFLNGNTEKLFCVRSCIKYEELKLSKIQVDKDGIQISISCVSYFPKFLLCEMSISIHNDKNERSEEEILLPLTSLKTLFLQGKVILNDSIFSIVINLPRPKKSKGNLMISVFLSESSIVGSPILLSWNDDFDKSNVWEPIENGGSGNISRTGKKIDDLDESDLISMGYKFSEQTLLCGANRIQTKVSPKRELLTDRNGLHLPLDQPSPLNALNSFKITNDTNNNHNNESAPCTSTLNNLSDRLQSISFSGLNDEDYEDDGVPMNAMAGIENLLRIQRVLTGGGGGDNVEESKHDKSVSFHPNTTIVEPLASYHRIPRSSNNPDLCDTKPYKAGLMDNTSSSSLLVDGNDGCSLEEQWLISTGLTKTNDGQLGLCKSILNNQNTLSLTNESTHWEPILDLSNSIHVFKYVQRIKLEEMPQMISRIGNQLFISHPITNKIGMFTDYKFNGYFKSCISLKQPRYVLALPNDKLSILDNNGLHIFTLSTQTHRKTMLTEIASSCRGLESYKDYLLTVLRSNDGSHVLIIDIEVKNNLVKKIRIEATCITEWHINKTKCLFLAYGKTNQKLYISDYGLNAVYVVDLENNDSSILCPSKKEDSIKLTEARGIVLDPIGNIIVASKKPGKLEVFNSEGEHVRAIPIEHVKEMAGLYFDDNDLLIASTSGQTLYHYTVETLL